MEGEGGGEAVPPPRGLALVPLLAARCWLPRRTSRIAGNAARFLARHAGLML